MRKSINEMCQLLIAAVAWPTLYTDVVLTNRKNTIQASWSQKASAES